MALNLQDKQEIVSEVNEVAKVALSAVTANPSGITVNEMTDLRQKSRDADVYMRVVRNTLLKRAVLETPFECLENTFTGPTLIAYSLKHPGAAARLLKEFARINTKLKIKFAAFEGELMESPQVDRLATLPTYGEAIVQLMVIMKEASAGRLARVLSAVKNIEK